MEGVGENTETRIAHGGRDNNRLGLDAVAKGGDDVGGGGRTGAGCCERRKTGRDGGEAGEEWSRENKETRKQGQTSRRQTEAPANQSRKGTMVKMLTGGTNAEKMDGKTKGKQNLREMDGSDDAQGEEGRSGMGARKR